MFLATPSAKTQNETNSKVVKGIEH